MKKGLLVLMSLLILLSGGCKKDSQAYRMSVDSAEKSAEVLKEFGHIKGYGWFPTGSVVDKGDTGKADLQILIVGEAKKGNLKTKLEKIDGSWQLKSATMKIFGGKHLDILNGGEVKKEEKKVDAKKVQAEEKKEDTAKIAEDASKAASESKTDIANPEVKDGEKKDAAQAEVAQDVKKPEEAPKVEVKSETVVETKSEVIAAQVDAPKPVQNIKIDKMYFTKTKGGESITPPEYKVGEDIFFYVRAAGFSPRADGNSKFSADLEVKDPTGNVVLNEKDLVKGEDKIGEKAALIHFAVTLPPGAPEGTYAMTATIKDSEAKSESRVDGNFNIKAQ